MSSAGVGRAPRGGEPHSDSWRSSQAVAETGSRSRRTPRWHEASRAAPGHAGARDRAAGRNLRHARSGSAWHGTRGRGNVLHTDEPPTAVQACTAFLGVACGASAPVIRVWEATACGPHHGVSARVVYVCVWWGGGVCGCGHQPLRADRASSLQRHRIACRFCQCMELVRHEEEVTALAWGCVASAWHLASACREQILGWPVSAALRDGESGGCSRDTGCAKRGGRTFGSQLAA